MSNIGFPSQNWLAGESNSLASPAVPDRKTVESRLRAYQLVEARNQTMLATANAMLANIRKTGRPATQLEQRVRAIQTRFQARQAELRKMQSKGWFDRATTYVGDAAQRAWQWAQRLNPFSGIDGLGEPVTISIGIVWIVGLSVGAGAAAIAAIWYFVQKAQPAATLDYNDLARLNPEIERLAKQLNPQQQRQLQQVVEETYNKGRVDGESDRPGFFSNLFGTAKNTLTLIGLGVLGFVAYNSYNKRK